MKGCPPHATNRHLNSESDLRQLTHSEDDPAILETLITIPSVSEIAREVEFTYPLLK